MDGFWLYMTIVAVIIPFAMILVGYRLAGKIPVKRNSPFGYRTKRAKLNDDTWEFANKHCGKTWYMLGIALAVLSLGVMRGCREESREMIVVIGGALVILQFFALLVSMLPTELALRKNFDEQGNRRM